MDASGKRDAEQQLRADPRGVLRPTEEAA